MNLFLTIVLAVYAGELIWRERSLRVAETTDACAVPNWVPLAAKLVALFGVIVTFCLVGVLFCIGYQLFARLHASATAAVRKNRPLTRDAAVRATAALFVFLQTISENKFFGYLLVVAFLVIKIALPLIGYDHPLYNYGSGAAVAPCPT